MRLVAAVVAVLGLALVTSGNDAADRAFLLFDSTDSIIRCVLFYLLFTVCPAPRGLMVNSRRRGFVFENTVLGT